MQKIWVIQKGQRVQLDLSKFNKGDIFKDESNRKLPWNLIGDVTPLGHRIVFTYARKRDAISAYNEAWKIN